MKRLSVEADIGTIVQQGNAGLYPYIIQQTVASTRECEEWPDQLEMHMVHTDCQTRGSLTSNKCCLWHHKCILQTYCWKYYLPEQATDTISVGEK
ncbi:uncharacterized protein [Pocillopora verrucosa]|uniref:uncharacterized protein isoform X6 n=1 Tax=Pocillopora verrucosa TaxID=203993 RepID=UPI0033411B31